MSTGPEPRDDDRAQKIGGEIVRRLKSYTEELQMPSEGMLRVPAGTPLSEILEVVNMGIGIEQVRAGTKQEDGSEDLYQVVFNLVNFSQASCGTALPDWVSKSVLETLRGTRVRPRRGGE